MKIDEYMFIEIGREEGAAPKLNHGFPEHIERLILIDGLPFGTPNDGVYKIVKLDGELYLTLLHMKPNEDYGLALSIKMNDKIIEKNPLGFIKSMSKVVTKVLAENGENLPNNLELEYVKPATKYESYKNLSEFIFSLLIEDNSIIIGELDEINLFIASVLECVPVTQKKDLTIIVNNSTIDKNVIMTGIPISDKSLKLLDRISGKYTIVFLPTKTAYGKYSSPFTKKVAKLFEDGDVDRIKEEISYFFADAVSSNELFVAADYAVQRKVAVSDATLMLWLRANYYHLELEKDIFSELED